MSSGPDTLARSGVVGAVRGGTGQLLERGDELAALSGELRAVVSSREGRLVLLAGEAGIGKTALVRAFCDRLEGVRVLWGACDALLTPRPLGPLVDVAEQTGGELAVALEHGAGAGELVVALARGLRRGAPSVVVVEDLHWADEATLDVLRLVARRIEALGALVLVTYRDDELDRVHPLRVVLGELPRAGVRRLSLAALSAAAVAELAIPHRVDPADLHARTGGNPFFVTEVLAAGSASLPDGVRDAVLARAARLDVRARGLLDAVAIVPPQAELWLLEALAGEELVYLERCLASGMLEARGGVVGFRHEIARVAIEDVLPPDRALALHRRAQAALIAPPSGRPDLARVAHHAEAGGDGRAVLQYAPAAGEQAAAVGAHREAAGQFRRALRYADGLGSEQRARLLERFSYESYLTGELEDAIAAGRAALSEHRGRGDRLREGDAHRWLSRVAWWAGDNRTAEIEARRAVELLERLPATRELAMAYSTMTQLRMLSADVAGTRKWGARAMELAERLSETEPLLHALRGVGVAEVLAGDSTGFEKLERSLALGLEAGLDEDVAQAYTNLAGTRIGQRDYALGDRYLEEGIAYCRERDLDRSMLYMIAWQARSRLEQGDFDQAAACATLALGRPGASALTRIQALAVLGCVRARRGDPEPWAPLDEAARLAGATGDLVRILPVAIARAEARWLAGGIDLVAVETETALGLAIAHQDLQGIGELLVWRQRAGMAADPSAATAAEPSRHELEEQADRAAELWRALGCPYQAALALLHSHDQAAQRSAVAEFQRLGARRTASRAARMLRAVGMRDLRQGPRAATKANPGGLTARQLEVLALVAAGMRNAEIAESLILSRRTIDSHIAAIMRKLDAGTRTQAVLRATDLGILER
jgi:DNA-binding CsgD family transcriptional regulator/tetratricopeptide (TPR) repeat protein